LSAPHTLPPPRTALSWLVDLLNYGEAESANEEFDADGFEDGHKMFFEYLSRGYAEFLSGKDDLSALDAEIASTFEMKNASLTGDIASLETANRELQVQFDALAGETPLQKAQVHNANLQSDTTKFEKHIGDLHDHRAKVQDKLEKERAEAAERKAELEEVLAEVEGLKKTVAAQELTPSDVKRMYSEQEHLENEVATLKAQKDALSSQLWDDELAISCAPPASPRLATFRRPCAACSRARPLLSC
jgi:kinetochore protein NDC80